MTEIQTWILGGVILAWCLVGLLKLSHNDGALTRAYGHAPSLLEQVFLILLWPMWTEPPA